MHRQLTVQISDTRYWGYPARKLGPRDHSSKIWTAVPWVGALGSSVPDFGRLLYPLETTGLGVVTPTANSPGPNRNQMGSSPETSLTSLGPNRTGKNQKGSSAETARPVLFTTETGKNQRGSSPETARLVLVPNRNREKPTAAHRRLLDQFWSLNPKGRQFNP